MSQAKTIKQVLQAAHWIIDNVGWCQESYYLDQEGQPNYDLGNPEGVCAACLTGAIYLVETEPQGWGSTSLNEQAVGAICVRIREYVPCFNDAPQRTKQQVLDTLQQTIDSLR